MTIRVTIRVTFRRSRREPLRLRLEPLGPRRRARAPPQPSSRRRAASARRRLGGDSPRASASAAAPAPAATPRWNSTPCLHRLRQRLHWVQLADDGADRARARVLVRRGGRLQRNLEAASARGGPPRHQLQERRQRGTDRVRRVRKRDAAPTHDPSSCFFLRGLVVPTESRGLESRALRVFPRDGKTRVVSGSAPGTNAATRASRSDRPRRRRGAAGTARATT